MEAASATHGPAAEGHVTIRVPATAANLGPGYDSFGLALALHNTFAARLAEEWRVEVTGEDAEHLRADERNPVAQAMAGAFAACGRSELRAHLTCDNRIPVGRGLGSSAAAVVGGLMLGFRLGAGQADEERVLEMAAAVEGHPDNVTAALRGGFVITAAHEGCSRVFDVPIAAGLAAVLAVSRLPLKTKRARKLVPESVPHADAAFNASRAGLLAAGIALGDAGMVAAGLHDRLHEPYRAPAIPGFDEVSSALREAGATGAVLSGAGPTVIGLVCAGSDDEAFARAEEVAAAAAPAVAGLEGYRVPAAVRVYRGPVR